MQCLVPAFGNLSLDFTHNFTHNLIPNLTQKRGPRMFNRSSLLMTIVLAASTFATQLTTQVTAFHQLEATPQPLAGKSFKLLPTVEQSNSLEFRTYSRTIDAALVNAGLIEAVNANADLIVAISYGVSPASPDASPRSGAGVGIGSGVGLGGGGISIGVGFPLAILSGAGATPNYRRELKVVIDRAPSSSAPSGTTTVNRVYEATAVSEGKAASISPVLPAMLQALFTDFPGKTGQTQVIRVDCPENKLDC